jgi:phage terminase small subunit
MPVLKNTRHEAFAQALAKGMTATDAYAAAGYKGDRTAASRLSTNVNVSQRVGEIKSRVAEKAEWTAADRLSALKSIFDREAEKDARVAISAIAEANKMQGSYAPSKSELTGKGGGPVQIADLSRLKGMTTEELQVLDRALVQIGIAEGDQDGTGEPEE